MDPKLVHISLDLETAALASNAAIVQIGAVVVGNHCMEGEYNFNARIDIRSSERAGLDVDKATMQWWDRQEPELRAEVFSGKESLKSALENFHDFCSNKTNHDLSNLVLWAKPISFDLPILTNAYETYKSYPFSHRGVGDIYTIQRALSDKDKAWCMWEIKDRWPEGKLHDALHDARYQSVYVERWLALLADNS